jgi:hypothetical protein
MLSCIAASLTTRISSPMAAIDSTRRTWNRFAPTTTNSATARGRKCSSAPMKCRFRGRATHSHGDDAIFISISILIFPIFLLYDALIRKHAKFVRPFGKIFGERRTSMAVLAILFIFFVYVFVLTRVVNWALRNQATVDEWLSKKWLLFPDLIVTVGLFYLRGRQPAIYGFLEIGIGIMAVYVAIGSTSAGTLAKVIALFTGIYIIVRGMDNVEKDLPNGIRDGWKKIFKKKAES